MLCGVVTVSQSPCDQFGVPGPGQARPDSTGQARLPCGHARLLRAGPVRVRGSQGAGAAWPESQWPPVAGRGPGSQSRLARAGEVWSLAESGLARLGPHELTTGGTALGAEARGHVTRQPGSHYTIEVPVSSLMTHNSLTSARLKAGSRGP